MLACATSITFKSKSKTSNKDVRFGSAFQTTPNRQLRAEWCISKSRIDRLLDANKKLASKLPLSADLFRFRVRDLLWGSCDVVTTSTLTPEPLKRIASRIWPRRPRISPSPANISSTPMPHEQLDPASPAPPYGDSESPPGTSSRFGTGSYEDIFTSLDAHPVLSRPLMHPGTGQPLTPTTPSESHCPTFRHPRPRTPKSYSHCPPSPRSAAHPSRPLSPVPPVPRLPPSPHFPLKTSHSTGAMSSIAGPGPGAGPGAGPSPGTAPPGPIYAPSRSSSTRSNYTLASATSAATAASRSSSTASRRSTMKPGPGPCALPPQPGRHNSLAELHARQTNVDRVVQPISPYAEEPNPLERVGYLVGGIVRRKSSGVELRGGRDGEGAAGLGLGSGSGSGSGAGSGGGLGLRKKSSFARLGWGGRGGGEYEVERRGSAPGVDVSRNF
ncbi:hypothetical protein PMIN06_002779 [Paraphaeosphaeria minitans]